MSYIQSLARGLTILDRLAEAEDGLSITELAEHLQIDKSSASRLMTTLVTHEFAQQKAGSRKFILGKRLFQMSWLLLNRMPVREKAKPFLYRLVAETGECAHTAVYAEGRALVIDDVEAETSLRVVGGVGRMIHLHCTAVGKALLAFSCPPMPEDLPSRTARTITEAAQLYPHIEYIRACGYALDDEENEDGVRCMAAPVYDYTGLAIAVIGISGPTVRITPDRLPHLAHQVTTAARELSLALGYQPAATEKVELRVNASDRSRKPRRIKP